MKLISRVLPLPFVLVAFSRPVLQDTDTPFSYLFFFSFFLLYFNISGGSKGGGNRKEKKRLEWGSR